MKKETMVGLMAVVAIVAVAISVGCIENNQGDKPTPTPSLTPTPTPKPTPVPPPTPEEKADSHLYEQMDRYKKGSTLRLIQSYVGTSTHPGDYMAWVYDNDLVVLALIDKGTPEDMSRANILCDALIWCQENDQNFNDGRIRDGYWASDLKDPSGKNSSIKSSGSGMGNMAWTIIALLRYYEVTSDTTYLNASKRLGNWINNTCNDTRGEGGYTGGYEDKNFDWKLEKIEWKSTEHNIDVYVAFMKLYEATGNSTWRERAIHAKMFVEAMWDEGEGYFWTGTMNDGITINKGVRPIDVNSWGLMALGDPNKYGRGITWVENNCNVTPCPKSCGFKGFDFNDDKDGVWFEGTAQMCIAYQIKNENDKSDEFINEIRRAQCHANNSNGKGIVAACHDNVTTGFGWNYSNVLHIGATAWYIFAERELNPYWGINTSDIIIFDITLPPTPTITPTPTPTPTVTDKIGITLEIRGNTAYGTVTGVLNYDDYRMVIYVETDKLYVQPVIDPPLARYRIIESDGSWDCSGMHIEYGGVVRAFLIEEGSNAPNTLPIGAEPDGVVARARKIL